MESHFCSTDLNSLMNMYQAWVNVVYPLGDLSCHLSLVMLRSQKTLHGEQEMFFQDEGQTLGTLLSHRNRWAEK